MFSINLYYTSLGSITQHGGKLRSSCFQFDFNISTYLNLLKMKVLSLILFFSFLMIEGRKQFGQVQHQKSLKISNTFPANDRVKRKKKLKGHYKIRIQIFISIYLHFHQIISLLQNKSHPKTNVFAVQEKKVGIQRVCFKKKQIFLHGQECFAMAIYQETIHHSIKQNMNTKSKHIWYLMI